MDEVQSSQMDLLAVLCQQAVAKHGADIPSIEQFVRTALDEMIPQDRARFENAVAAFLAWQRQGGWERRKTGPVLS